MDGGRRLSGASRTLTEKSLSYSAGAQAFYSPSETVAVVLSYDYARSDGEDKAESRFLMGVEFLSGRHENELSGLDTLFGDEAARLPQPGTPRPPAIGWPAVL